MRFKSLINMALFLFLGFGIFFYVSKSKKNLEADEFPWASVRKDAVYQIEVKHLDGEKYVLEKNEGQWVVVKPEFYATLPEKSAIFVNSFMNLKPKEILRDVSAEEYSAYGFQRPTVKILAKIKDRPDTVFSLGAKTSVGEDVYAAVEGFPDTAFVVSIKDAGIFSKGLAYLLDTYILQGNGEQAAALGFRNFDNEEVSFRKTNGFWVQEKEMITTRDWGLRRFLLTAADLSVERENLMFQVPIEKAAEQGVDMKTAPYLSLTFENGQKSALYVGPRVEHLYRVYLPEMKLLAWMQAPSVHEIFGLSPKDWEIKSP